MANSQSTGCAQDFLGERIGSILDIGADDGEFQLIFLECRDQLRQLVFNGWWFDRAAFSDRAFDALPTDLGSDISNLCVRKFLERLYKANHIVAFCGRSACAINKSGSNSGGRCDDKS